jgi:hypothetical protein
LAKSKLAHVAERHGGLGGVWLNEFLSAGGFCGFVPNLQFDNFQKIFLKMEGRSYAQ